MQPEDDTQLLDEPLLGTLTGFVQTLALTEPSFGYANALLKYGRGYSSLGWLMAVMRTNTLPPPTLPKARKATSHHAALETCWAFTDYDTSVQTQGAIPASQ